MGVQLAVVTRRVTYLPRPERHHDRSVVDRDPVGEPEFYLKGHRSMLVCVEYASERTCDVSGTVRSAAGMCPVVAVSRVDNILAGGLPRAIGCSSITTYILHISQNVTRSIPERAEVSAHRFPG
jgi:hypothetical protein